nr:cell wall hydrolase [Pseudogemmobacter hezensis]
MRPASGVTPPPEADVTQVLPGKSISPEERDVVIRTVLGEAAGESNAGMAAVAMVIRNRADDTRYPDSVGEVSLQPRQFSAWNEDGSGNDLVTKYGPGSPQYERAAYIVDVVMAGLVPDFTEGATHYYSPAGMRALVDQGYQKNLIPTWLERETASRDTLPVQVGGHVFTGRARSED